MSEHTTAIERNIMPKVGPRFFREDDAVMFEFVVDPNNIIGPRRALSTDSAKHQQAWSAFVAGDEPEVIEVVPDARELEPPAPPLKHVEALAMDCFAARLAPLPRWARMTRPPAADAPAIRSSSARRYVYDSP